jgi:predicted DNA-binding protein
MSIVVDKINPNLLKTISEIAKKENKTETKVLEDVIKKGLKSRESKELAFERMERLTNGKMKILNKDTYNPNPTDEELDSIVGIFKAPKGVSPVKALLDLRI